MFSRGVRFLNKEHEPLCLVDNSLIAMKLPFFCRLARSFPLKFQFFHKIEIFFSEESSGRTSGGRKGAL